MMARKTRKETDESEKPKTPKRSARSRKAKEMKAEGARPKKEMAIKEEVTNIETRPAAASEDRTEEPPRRIEFAEEAGVQGPFEGVPSMIWSTYGNRGNFDLIVPLANGGMAHYWRDNDKETLPWNGPEVFGRDAGLIYGASLIQSNFGEQGNLELVASAVGGHKLMHFWRDSGPGYDWNGPNKISKDSYVPMFSGNPAMIQSRSGQRGNFDVVVPRAEGGFSYYWRNNDDPELTWNGPIDFAADAGIFDAATLIQSNFDDHLEMVARSGDELFFFWRDSGLESEWHGTELIATGVDGTPSMIQSSNEGKGNFELVTPMRSGGLGYYWRDNNDPHLHWYGPFMFAMNIGKVDAVSLIQSDFGESGNLELVAQIDNQLAFFWRDSGMDRKWNGPQFLLAGLENI